MPLTVNYDFLKEKKFDYPFRILISGSSQSGKTTFARELLNGNGIFKQSVRSVRYCHPDYLTELPVDWHNSLDIPVSYQSGIPSLDEMCKMENHTCIVLDDLYEEAIMSRAADYLFRVLSGKKNISVIIMSQRYFAKGRFGMNIRNNCNFTVMMRNSDGRVNERIARNLDLSTAIHKAVEDTYANNYYPYIFVDSSPRGQVSGYRCYTNIFGKVQTVFNQRGMKSFIISEHDFLSNFTIINNTTAKRKVDQTENKTATDDKTNKTIEDGVDKKDEKRDSECESKQETGESIKETNTREIIKVRSRELRNKQKIRRRFGNSLY